MAHPDGRPMSTARADGAWSIYTDHPPRRWQAEAYPVAMASIRSRAHDVLQATTGAGKTRLQVVILASILRSLREGWVCVVSVPRQILVEQTVAELHRVLGPDVAGAWYGRRKKLARVIVCCHQSAMTLADELLVRRIRVAFWMADECHRADTDEMIAAVVRWAPSTRLGITATPFRSVATDALRGWSGLCYRYTIDQAIDDGVLVPPQFVHWDGEDGEDANVATIAMVRDRAPDGPGIVSAADTEDAEWFADQLRANGIPADAIHSKLRRADRAERMGRLMSGRVRCLVHVDLLTEGIDVPSLRWLAMRRPRRGAVAIVQEVGRVLRTLTSGDEWGPKARAVILLPHATPVLDSIARGAALTPILLREAAERETDPKPGEEPAESVLPRAVAIRDVVGWVEALVSAAVRDGLPVRGDDETATRDGVEAPSLRQIDALRRLIEDRRKSPARHLPKDHREAIYAVLTRPEGLTYGSARDLVRLMDALREHGWQYRRRTGKWWGGLRTDLPDVPSVAVASVSGDPGYWTRHQRGAR